MTTTPATAQHTPGPWAVIHHDDDSNRVVIRGICEVWSTSRGTEAKLANARLIAAAPDLLAACKAAQALLSDMDASGFDADKVEAILSAAIQRATA